MWYKREEENGADKITSIIILSITYRKQFTDLIAQKSIASFFYHL
jgi:hypothetical protein